MANGTELNVRTTAAGTRVSDVDGYLLWAVPDANLSGAMVRSIEAIRLGAVRLGEKIGRANLQRELRDLLGAEASDAAR